MLRILFSRLGQPHIGSPNAFSFNPHRRAPRGLRRHLTEAPRGHLRRVQLI
jgi:hypothetical protein